MYNFCSILDKRICRFVRCGREAVGRRRSAGFPAQPAAVSADETRHPAEPAAVERRSPADRTDESRPVAADLAEPGIVCADAE